MKKLKISILAFSAALMLNACSPTAEEARTYNDNLIALEHPLTAKENAFLDQLSSAKSPEELKKSYDELVSQSEASLASAEKMEGFDNSTAYRDAAKEYFSTIKGIVNNEYKTIVELASKNPEEVTDEDSKKYEELITSVEEKSGKVLAKIQTEQSAFAAKYKFEIEPTVEAAKN
jgi:predicted secreted protein